MKAIFLSIILPIAVTAIEILNSDSMFYIFSENIGNRFDNEKFCTKYGMTMLDIKSIMEENVVKTQNNRFIDWIWIDSTYKISEYDCPHDCCSVQMEIMENFKSNETNYRIAACLNNTAYLACSRNLSDIGDIDATLVTRISDAMKESDEVLVKLIEKTQSNDMKINSDITSIKRHTLYLAIATAILAIFSIIDFVVRCMKAKTSRKDMTRSNQPVTNNYSKANDEPIYDTPREEIAQTNL